MLNLDRNEYIQTVYEKSVKLHDYKEESSYKKE